MVLLQLLTSVTGALVLFCLYHLPKLVHEEFTSPLRDLPGPKSEKLFYGIFKSIWEAENLPLLEKWVEEYGTTIGYRGLLSTSRLFTMDTKALNHVLMNNNDYQMPSPIRYNLSRIMGPGVLVVEGDKHKQQRRIMNPAFGPSQVRELTEIFVAKSIQLRNIWAAESSNQGGVGRIDVLSWLGRTTLDIIGIAGFNYQFNAMEASGKPNELSSAFATMFRASLRMSPLPLLQALFPVLQCIPAQRDAQFWEAHETMSRIGSQILRDSKASIEATTEKGDSTEKSSRQARDLLSLLVRANMATGLPDCQRMTDGEILAQVPTFLVTGHETTGTGTTWALYALSQNRAVQTKLRNELLTVPTDNPTMDELNALPYLDHVIRETMRVHAPVPYTIRVAMKDDVLPLNNPFTDKKGNVHHEIRISKGQEILIPILGMNRAKSLWGEDAREFKPERWESVPEAVSSMPGIWGNLLTFLAGPRACIGYRFSLVEMKALLFTLVRAFEFELAVPAEDITSKSSIVQRPVLDGSYQLPLSVKPYRAF